MEPDLGSRPTHGLQFIIISSTSYWMASTTRIGSVTYERREYIQDIHRLIHLTGVDRAAVADLFPWIHAFGIQNVQGSKMNGKRIRFPRIHIELALYESIETDAWFSVFGVLCGDPCSGWKVEL